VVCKSLAAGVRNPHATKNQLFQHCYLWDRWSASFAGIGKEHINIFRGQRYRSSHLEFANAVTVTSTCRTQDTRLFTFPVKGYTAESKTTGINA